MSVRHEQGDRFFAPHTHIERIYAKTGASTRSTVTLFAMQHGLLDTLDPVDL